MKILNRYLAKVVVSSIFIVLFIVVGLDAIFSMIAEYKDLENNYQSLQALQFVLLSMPKNFYEFSSASVLIGSLVGLGILANNSELTVMRAAGLSIEQIAWSVIKPSLVVVFASILVGEFVVPYTESYAVNQKAVAQKGNTTSLVKHGYWHREGNDYMHFNAILPGGVLYGVTRYQFTPQRELINSSFSYRANFQGDHWVLQDVTQTDIKDGEARQLAMKSQRWDTELTPEVLNVVIAKPEDLSIRGLYTYSNYLLEQGLNAQKYLLAFWKKIFQPLAMVVMVLVAISCVFGPLRTVTMGYRIFMGIMLGVTFQFTEDLLGPASIVFGFPPVIASLIPIALFFGFALVLIRRAG